MKPLPKTAACGLCAAALIAPAKAGLPVAEYAAKVVKKAVVGTGGADKDQVAFMIARLLPTAGSPTADAADALAVALTHAHSSATAGRSLTGFQWTLTSGAGLASFVGATDGSTATPSLPSLQPQTPLPIRRWI